MPTKRSMLSQRATAAARGRQRGITLIVVLILLVVVTVLGIGGTRIALLSERSTRFDRDHQVAWQAAEAALVDAEYDIAGPNTSPNQRLAQFTSADTQQYAATCGTTHATRGLCAYDKAEVPPYIWESVNFLDESNTAPTVGFGDKTGFTMTVGSSGVQPARRPRYIIQRIPNRQVGGTVLMDQSQETGANVYRITSMGFGPNEQVQVLMQSTFARVPP